MDFFAYHLILRKYKPKFFRPRILGYHLNACEKLERLLVL